MRPPQFVARPMAACVAGLICTRGEPDGEAPPTAVAATCAVARAAGNAAAGNVDWHRREAGGALIALVGGVERNGEVC